MFAYVGIKGVEVDTMQNKFLKSLYGQIHVKFEEHKIPLVALV